jgi:phosphatidylinositol alpha-1,6-mannosyltransferase
MLWHNVDAIITPSRALQEVLRANRIQVPEMIHLPNGINPARFESNEADQAAFRAEHGLADKRVILFAGRINRAKGGEQILRALPHIIAQVPEALLLVLARPGGYGEGMLSIAESLGIRQHIRFVGWLSGETLAAAFSAADVCVTPSVYFDNFPTVNLEAQAAGTPVVGTCFGGTPEAVVDGETGFIVNPYNVEQLAGRISRLLSDDTLRTRMGAQARRRVQQQYHWLTQGEKLVKLYRRIMDRA